MVTTMFPDARWHVGPEDLIWLPDIIDKLSEKHQVETEEVFR
jgi:hypothetical protein